MTPKVAPTLVNFAKGWSWARCLIVMWLLLIVWSARWVVVPTNWVFEVEKVALEPEFVLGECPPMTIRRTIHRPFTADWVVSIDRKWGEGYVTYRQYSGGNDYRPGNQLPKDVDLAWWAGMDEPCNLPPGDYRIRTTWVLDWPDGSFRFVRAIPQDFTIMKSEN